MSSLAIGKNSFAVTKGLKIDYFNQHKNEHTTFEITTHGKSEDSDSIADIIISSDDAVLAVITVISKELIVFTVSDLQATHYNLPRSASKIRFTKDEKSILVADKSGDALIYSLNSDVKSGNKILGHLSLLLDILQTEDSKYIITSDRDEKIKVSCYPNTYNIQTYCLGHKEFVNHINLLPHDPSYLLSSSGDGTIKVWEHVNGKQCYSIDINSDIKDKQLKEDFINSMNDDGIQVEALPIVHFSVTILNKTSSLIAATVHNNNQILLYSLSTDNNKMFHDIKSKISLKRFPNSIKLSNSNMYVFDDVDNIVKIYEVSNCGTIDNSETEIKMFTDFSIPGVGFKPEAIKMLYKRKFDNVQEYQERKKQRLEKCK